MRSVASYITTSLCVVGARGGIAAVAGPVGVEELASGAIEPLVHPAPLGVRLAIWHNNENNVMIEWEWKAH